MDTRREKIFDIYKDIEDVLQMDDNFRFFMTTEFDHVTKDLDKLESTLRSIECPILIAGETSAGKSTLINLLIGKPILPVKFLSCTSTICKIWNSEQRKIVFTDTEDKKHMHSFNSDGYEGEMKTLLTENMGKKSEDNKWKYVDIYIPVPLLEDNITIVDSPGIQEKDTAFMERLYDYLPNAIALIYVIDSSKAGGLENSEWLNKILLKITEQQKKGHMLHFQTETILFLCNKWDQVPEEEEHEVMDFVLGKLTSIWSDFNPEKQLFKFSCKTEGSAPTQKYIDLVEAISKMKPILLEAKLITHVKWQKYVVQKMIDRIASLIVTSKQTNEERERRIQNAEERLELLKKKLKKVKSSVLQKVDEKGKLIAKDIVRHLITSKEKIFRFNESDLVKNPAFSELVDPVNKIRTRIENEISTWCMKNKDNVDKEIETMIKNEFKIVEEDLRIQDGILGSIDACQSYHGNFTIFSSAVFGLSPFVSHIIFQILALPNLQITFPMTIAITALVYIKHKYLGKSATEIKTIFEDNIFDKFVTEKNFFKLMQPFLKHLKDKITYICEIDVPRILIADKMFIDSALKQRSSFKEIICTYRPLQYQCETLLGKIEIFLLGYFRNIKLSFRYISDAKLKHEIGKGSFSIVQSATISINNVDTIVAVKTLRTPLEDIYSYKQLSEALILRELNKGQQNIIKLYGISLSESLGKRYLQIYMEYCDDSLFSIVMKKQTPRACSSFEKVADCRDSWTFVISIMDGVCSALDYVHRAGFVHRDLKLENILVKGGHSVRLADFGLSKNEENITGTIAGTPLYMAPEVMKEYLYGSEADIYSLGMVLYELWYYRPVFTRPLKSSPSKYEFTFHNRKDLEDKVLKGCRPDCEIPLKPPVELKAVMDTCWDANREKRPTALEVYNRLTKVQLN